jgi:acyl-CoA reductase-like NAD-dependent aldehyde dehydrogenase
MTFREPLDVVAVIAPWDFPLPVASWNIAPALAAGNSVIVMPTQLTPLSTRRPPHAGAVRQHTPMSLGHHTRVTSFLTSDVDAVKLGREPSGPVLWMAPRAVGNPVPLSRVATEEIFGPIAANIWF